MKNLKLISNSPLETTKIAQTLAKFLNIGDTVVLTGELGAGKTKFTEGFLTYYNLQDEISSPTFTIVNEYKSPLSTIYHFDVYRLADLDEFYAIGGDEYFDKGICLIEWGEQIEDALPLELIKISFEKNSEDDNSRILNFEAIGNKYEKILDSLSFELKN
jgi:tRNA threonylcarbamoyladenosine biosynthesis protein TsaE